MDILRNCIHFFKSRSFFKILEAVSLSYIYLSIRTRSCHISISYYFRIPEEIYYLIAHKHTDKYMNMCLNVSEENLI